MESISILIGGKAGDGIRQAGHLIGELFNELGYWVFVYDDYPSLITGGHNFCLIRIAENQVQAPQEKIDFLIAFNEETFKKHQSKLKKDALIITDADAFKTKNGIGIFMSKIAKQHQLPLFVRNSIILGFLAGLLHLDFSLVEKIIKKIIPRKIKENIEVAKLGYEEGKKIKNKIKIKKLKKRSKKLLTGNESIALGAVAAGLKFYIAYPMTPVTSILHFLAAKQDEFKIKTIQPENEIAVALMAEGVAYAGKRVMIGTSGGGFALMVESLSLAGQAEIPIVYVYGQRSGPSTGMPTYTSQSDLFFVLKAGHGEFLRLVVAPGDADEAFYLTAEAMNLAWRYQIPTFVLTDKHLSESIFTTVFEMKEIKERRPKIWLGQKNYQRYLITQDGISPLAFPGGEAIVKSNSYSHDEFGLTTEEPKKIEEMIKKGLRKRETLIKELKNKETVKVYGNRRSKIALITWGSTKGAVVEVGEKLGLKIIQPLFLEPFPEWAIKKELKNVKRIIDVEVNAFGQLSDLLKQFGLVVDKKILKYDGRPFFVEELRERIKKIL
ncbi:MAG: 2-oxoacid:acceptor oxidoreductase subunit alpha [Patescibacteria group bacterium]